ncbi:MAG: hypothetical protein Q8O40_10575 [Chloroflexota bacterium]|nr:hypothetical protein [Chloroflexota bacterium]
MEVAIPFFGGPEFMGLYQALDRPSYLRPIYQRLRSLQGQRWNNESQLSHAIALTLADLKLEGPREPGSDFVIHLDTPVLLEAKVRGPALLRNVAQLMTYMYEEHVQWGLLVKATPNSLLLKALRRQA